MNNPSDPPPDDSYIEVEEKNKGNTLVMSFRRELPNPASATKAADTGTSAAAADSAGGAATAAASVVGAAGATDATGISHAPIGDAAASTPTNDNKAAGASAASSAGGTTTAASVVVAAAGASGTSHGPIGDPQRGTAAGRTAAAASTTASARPRPGKRTPRQGTVSYKEEFQASKPPPHRSSYYEGRWKNNFAELLKFHEQHGHCNVPQSFPSNPALSEFVRYVRARQEELSEERLQMLEDLGFVFNVYEDQWSNKFRELKNLLGEAGRSDVGSSISALISERSPLHRWIRHQRGEYAKLKRGKKSTMTEDRVSLLESIGMDLDPTGMFAEGVGDDRRKKGGRKVSLLDSCCTLFVSSSIFGVLCCMYILPACNASRERNWSSHLLFIFIFCSIISLHHHRRRPPPRQAPVRLRLTVRARSAERAKASKATIALASPPGVPRWKLPGERLPLLPARLVVDRLSKEVSSTHSRRHLTSMASLRTTIVPKLMEQRHVRTAPSLRLIRVLACRRRPIIPMPTPTSEVALRMKG